jgi:tripartite-type tricarboxylate transporter receptor subunit TctC
MGTAALFLTVPAQAADFFAGKTVTVITSTSPGGGFEAVARGLTRHMPGYIPGAPTMIVQYMPGAGHVLASNFLYNLAPKDGTTIANINDAIPLHQVLDGRGVRFDARKFQWLGAMGAINSSIFVWHTSGIKTVQDAMNREVIFGSTGAGSGTALYSTAMNNLLGTKFKIVSGYKNTDEIAIALERGEVEATSSSLTAIVGHRQEWVTNKKIVFIAQVGGKRYAQLPDVPLLTELAKTDEQRTILRLISAPTTIGRPYAAPPETPVDRVAMLRKAFEQTMHDPAFLAEMKSADVYIDPRTGDDVAKDVDETISVSDDIIEKTKAAMPK